MTEAPTLPSARDKLLFTPGPLTTSLSVKQAMLHDAGSWHGEFNALVASIRERLLALAGLTRAAGWEVVLLQGSGTFGVESVFQTCVPPHGKVAVLTNGAYGERMVQMLAQARLAPALPPTNGAPARTRAAIGASSPRRRHSASRLKVLPPPTQIISALATAAIGSSQACTGSRTMPVAAMASWTRAVNSFHPAVTLAKGTNSARVRPAAMAAIAPSAWLR